MVRFLVVALLVVSCSSADDTIDRDAASSVTFFTLVARPGAFEPPPPDVDLGCMPIALPVDAGCAAQCTMIVALDEPEAQATGCTSPGMSQLDATALAWIQNNFASLNGFTPATMPVFCVLEQRVGGPTSSVAMATGCTNPTPTYDGLKCTVDPSANGGWCNVIGVGNTNDGCVDSIEIVNSLPSSALVILACSERLST